MCRCSVSKANGRHHHAKNGSKRVSRLPSFDSRWVIPRYGDFADKLVAKLAEQPSCCINFKVSPISPTFPLLSFRCPKCQVHLLQRAVASKQDHIDHLNRQASLGFLREAREQVIRCYPFTMNEWVMLYSNGVLRDLRVVYLGSAPISIFCAR